MAARESCLAIGDRPAVLMSRPEDYGGDVSPVRRPAGHLIEKVEGEVENLIEILNSLTIAREELQSQCLSDVSIDEVETEVTRLVQLYKLKEVLSVFQETKKLHASIENCLQVKSGRSAETDVKLLEAVDNFQQLVVIARKVFAISPAGSFLSDYVQRMLMHWHEELLKHLAPRFEKLYESANWPIVTVEATNTPHAAVTKAFDNFFISLLKIEVRDVAPDHQPLVTCLPIELMLKPFKKRFHYHFMGNTRTNQLDKPEWYLTQVLNWIKDNSKFLANNVDSLLRLQATSWPAGKIQMTIGLMGMIREKIQSDLEQLIYDDKNFSHTVDEVYLFIKELKAYLGSDAHYVMKCCDLFSVFLEKTYFTRLLEIEKKQSSAYVDSILESKTAWSAIAVDWDSDEDDRKVPEAADNFIILLQSIIERSLVIQSSQDRQPFVDLIIELIADFHLRLSQLVRSSFSDADDGCSYWPFSSRYFAILNTVQYLIEVMEDWRCLPFIIESNSSEEKLQSMIVRFEHLIKDTLIPRTIDGFQNELRNRISRFSDVRWFCLKDEDGSVDAAECEVLHFISAALELCSRRLTHSVSDHVIKCFAKQVNDIVIQEVLLKNTFNETAAIRIHKHVHRHLSALFRNSRTESFFAE